MTQEQILDARKQLGLPPNGVQGLKDGQNSVPTNTLRGNDLVRALERGEFRDTANVPENTDPSAMKKTFSEKIADFTGGKEIAQGLGQAIANKEISKSIDETQKSQFDIQGKLIEKIKEKKAIGEDTSRLENALDIITEDIQKTGSGAEKLLNQNELTPRKVVGDALQLGTTVATVGSLPKVVGGAKSVFKAKTISQGVLEGIEGGGKVGGAFGAASGLSSGLQEDKSGEDLFRSTAKGAILGGVTGGALGGTLGGVSARFSPEVRAAMKAKQLIADGEKVDKLAGRIIQGSQKDIEKAKKALSNIDVKEIKTYDELKTTLDDKVSNISTKLDDVLSKDTKSIKLKDLQFAQKVGEQTIQHNYVEDALTQLDDLYTKTNDVTAKSEIAQLMNKAKTQGLSIKEVNNLAREHGQKLNAFNANGQAASGLTKQAAENTRIGLKSTARGLFKNPVFQATDEELTNLIRTRDLVTKVSEKVNDLQQRVVDRGWGEKVGRVVAQVVDKITGGGVSGFLRSYLVPRGGGLKTLNALDLERGLQKNLKQLQELTQKDLPEETILQKLEAILNQSAIKNPISQSENITVKNIPQNPISRTVPQTFKKATISNFRSGKIGESELSKAIIKEFPTIDGVVAEDIASQAAFLKEQNSLTDKWLIDKITNAIKQ